MIRRPPRSTRKESSAASDVYKRQVHGYWWKLPLDWFLVGKDKVVAKANEMELASAMQKKLQEGTYWMYEFHNEVLKGILDNETIDNVLNKKKKIEE
eukprot:TRINITY_DN2617_c0_g2_i2.p1 TRINITY_DN2617_c0_g2~~TRINITY_DN2617_c0_g2_i2.p1  ORF type:complete len:104 (+),score=46.24 TRINITY_DN2617_c0_g2_i2:24-314(+)